jgi:hypothetical protein
MRSPSLGLHAPEVVDAKRGSPQLVGLTVDEASKVLSLIEGTLPAVNVFFELGREGGSAGVSDLEAFRLVDIIRHSRLQTMEQLAGYLTLRFEQCGRMQTRHSTDWISGDIASSRGRPIGALNAYGRRSLCRGASRRLGLHKKRTRHTFPRRPKLPRPNQPSRPSNQFNSAPRSRYR